MKQCPNCQKEFKEQLLFCPFDGQHLEAKPEQDKLIGAVLDNKYRLEEKIGEGGMGKVYRATHIHMDHTVAIKVLHPHLSSDHIAVERFRREARAAAQIRHPNAVAVTDFGVTMNNTVAYLVMEFLRGQDLRQKIEERNQLDYEEVFLVVQQACSALEAAHAKGIIHRDLKPDNIWLLKTENNVDQVKVLDFGIAKLQTTTDMIKLTQQGMIVGTPHYMSPEQCRGEELDARSDIYSMGVIVYEMLTGQVPFRAATPVGVVIKHASEPPNPPRQLRPDIPVPVEEVVMRSLMKNRDERQASALEMVRSFEAALYEAGIEPKWTGTKAIYTPYVSGSHGPVPGLTPPVATQTVSTAEQALDAHPLEVHPSGTAGSTGAARAIAVDTPALADADQGPHKSNSADFAPEQWLIPERSLLGRMPGAALAAVKHKKALIAAAVVIFALTVAIMAIKMSSTGNKGPGTADGSKPPVAPQGMAFVKGGKFLMGTDDSKGDHYSKPAHPETVNDFFLDINEVTNEDYQRFVKETGNAAPTHWEKGQFKPGTGKMPVVNVSWLDAKAYADWARKRLPTESEWEYAARGSTGFLYPWGDEWSPIYANLKEGGHTGPVAVGNYPDGRSWCGIKDMVGNVSEWVADSLNPYPSIGSQLKPDQRVKVYRGGSYSNSKSDMVTTNRWFDYPGKKTSTVGFRCARDVTR